MNVMLHLEIFTLLYYLILPTFYDSISLLSFILPSSFILFFLLIHTLPFPYIPVRPLRIHTDGLTSTSERSQCQRCTPHFLHLIAQIDCLYLLTLFQPARYIGLSYDSIGYSIGLIARPSALSPDLSYHFSRPLPSLPFPPAFLAAAAHIPFVNHTHSPRSYSAASASLPAVSASYYKMVAPLCNKPNPLREHESIRLARLA